ncbi:MAG: hypothetical protein JXR43_08350 [Burkholderiaceae bacterium]|nr:hypothetical protein [Burkholderiaceae bacterium]
MSKLARFRQWLEIEGAAQYLSTVWGESVTPADILRLGLDGKLTLSVHLVNLGSGRPVNIVPLQSVPRKDVPDPFEPGVLIRIYKGDKISDTEAITIPDTLTAEKLEGVYDLPMIGAEVLEVEHAYQCLVGGASIELTMLAGCFVQRDNRTYQLLERWPKNEYHAKLNAGKPYMHLDWFFPAQTLPEGAAIVVRTDALRALEPLPASHPAGHSTTLLRHMFAAIEQLWTLYDPAEADTAPTNEQVEAFLTNRGVPKRTAEVMATILRADGLRTGPRK